MGYQCEGWQQMLSGVDEHLAQQYERWLLILSGAEYSYSNLCRFAIRVVLRTRF